MNDNKLDHDNNNNTDINNANSDDNDDNNDNNNDIPIENGRLQYASKIKEIYQSCNINNANDNNIDPNNKIFNIHDLLQVPELTILSDNKININNFETQIKDYFQILSSDLSIYDALKELEKNYGFPFIYWFTLKRKHVNGIPKISIYFCNCYI